MRTRERRSLEGRVQVWREVLDLARCETPALVDPLEGGYRAETRRLIGIANRELAALKRLLDPARSARAKKGAATRRKIRAAPAKRAGSGVFALGGPAAASGRFPQIGDRVLYSVSGRGKRERGSGIITASGGLVRTPRPAKRARAR